MPACPDAGSWLQHNAVETAAIATTCQTRAIAEITAARLRMHRMMTHDVRMPRPVLATRTIFLVATLLAGTGVHAQTQAERWRWSMAGNVFAGVNHQERKFTDFTTFESQNWIMGTGDRPLGRGRLILHTMLSFEPVTLKSIGSPQVFQTGETFNRSRLIDYQHPHDLLSTLSAAYARPVGTWILTAAAAAVGSPALGPQPFMHRSSAAENPQTPLAHHHLDSVHITPGVLTAGVSRSAFGLEASWFHGREPDEDRTDIDFGALDSWSLRGSWASGPWIAQLSGARINDPEPLAPGDATRIIASIAHTRRGTIPTALFAAWGHNREAHGSSNGFMFETNTSWLDRNYLFSRIELVGKELPHSHAGIDQPSHAMNIGAFTLGYTRDVLVKAFGQLGLGGDMTMYYVPRELQESYGAPLSFHLFLRYRFGTRAAAGIEQHHH
jgi:hypothetical protein